MFSGSRTSKLAFLLCISMVMLACSGCGIKQHDTSEILSLNDITYPINSYVVDIPDEEVPVTDSINTPDAGTVNNMEDSTDGNTENSLEPSVGNSEAQSLYDSGRYYQFSSSYTDLYIEEFALQIKTDILTGNWEDLSGMISYPITIKGVEYKSSADFLGADWDNAFSSEWLGELMEEDCNKMGQNGEGFMMANGEIWVYSLPSGASSQLKIVAING